MPEERQRCRAVPGLAQAEQKCVIVRGGSLVRERRSRENDGRIMAGRREGGDILGQVGFLMRTAIGVFPSGTPTPICREEHQGRCADPMRIEAWRDSIARRAESTEPDGEGPTWLHRVLGLLKRRLTAMF